MYGIGETENKTSYLYKNTNHSSSYYLICEIPNFLEL